jgi:hypothetical protein
MLPRPNFVAYVESRTGFTLDVDSLDNTVLGFPLTALDDPRVKIKSVNVSGGRNRELDVFKSSTATVVFDNRDGLFNPNSVSSPYYGLIFPGKPFQVNFTNTVSSDFPNILFSGNITSIDFIFDVNGDAVVSISASDLFTLLANIEIPDTAVPQESTGARATRIFALAGFNAAQYDVEATTYSTMIAATISGNALSLLQSCMTAEQGQMYCYNGAVVFRGRNYNQYFPNFSIDATGGSGAWVAGFNVFPSTALDFAYSDDSIVNQVTTTSSLGTATFSNTASIEQFGVKAKSFDTQYASLAEQISFAQFIASSYGTPQFRVMNATFSVDDALTAPYGGLYNGLIAYYLLLYTCLPFSTVNIKFNPPGDVSEDIDQYSQLTSWSHSATPGGYNINVGFEPAVFRDTFRLDSNILGFLDFNRLAF